MSPVMTPVTAPTIDELKAEADLDWFVYQAEAFDEWVVQAGQKRACLYFRTGAGKTITSLAMVRLAGYTEATVIAPPITHESWEKWGTRLGVKVSAMSHAKFRMKGTKLSRHVPLIADEFHLFGGHNGKGWKKLDALARGMTAPVVLASATPNYNDAERVYCIQHILDPGSVKGGYLEFLYQHCVTEQNQFGTEPLVTGFRHHAGAEDYLSALPRVYYVPDEVDYTVDDIVLDQPLPDEFEEYGLDRRRGRIMASGMEKRHATVRHQLLDDHGLIRKHVFDELLRIVAASATPVLVFCAKAEIARALGDGFHVHQSGTRLHHGMVTGTASTKSKAMAVDLFRRDQYDLLIGTATLATGTDGVDKMCDTLVILNDTDDDAQRRQLIGRIMPRGADDDATRKKVYRIVMSS